MTVRAHPMGLGESLGDDLIINGPLLHTGQVWWVDSATGADAASPRGLERNRPLATLAQAVTNATDGDTIVLMDGHTETLSGALTISKRLTIVGSGLSDGEPTVELGVTGNVVMLTVSGDQVELRNIKFVERSTSSTNHKVNVTGSGFRMRGCHFECGDNDQGYSLRLAGSYSLVRDTTFESTADAVATAPVAAVRPIGSAGIFLEGCTFDGGTVGWANGWALDQDGDGSGTSDLRAENITVLRGSDIRLQADTTGLVLANAGSYAPRIDWSGAAGGA